MSTTGTHIRYSSTETYKYLGSWFAVFRGWHDTARAAACAMWYDIELNTVTREFEMRQQQSEKLSMVLELQAQDMGNKRIFKAW